MIPADDARGRGTENERTYVLRRLQAHLQPVDNDSEQAGAPLTPLHQASAPPIETSGQGPAPDLGAAILAQLEMLEQELNQVQHDRLGAPASPLPAQSAAKSGSPVLPPPQMRRPDVELVRYRPGESTHDSASGAQSTWLAPSQDPAAPAADHDFDDEDEAGDGGRRPRWWWLLLVIGVVALLGIAGVVVGMRLLARPATPEAGPSTPTGWPPPGRIIFQSDRDTPGQPQLYSLRLDSLATSQLPIGLTYVWNPRISPDGQLIAFIGKTSGIDDIYVADITGQNLRRVTNRAGHNRHPNWSPDGQWLAFGSDRTGNWDVFVARIDGSEVRNVTNNPADDNLPAYSPDGRAIAFQSNRSGRTQIFRLDLTGGQAVSLSNGTGNDSYPQWSPNGSLIAFHSNREGDNDIFVMNADGRNPRNLTRHAANDELAVWSPDGEWLLFASNRNGDMELYAVNVKGGEAGRLTFSPSHDWAPAWGR